MKKNLLIKILALVLVLSFAFVLFAACNKNPKDDPKPAPKPDDPTPTPGPAPVEDEITSGQLLATGAKGALEGAERFVNNINEEKINLGVDGRFTFKSGDTELDYRLDFDVNVELDENGEEAASLIVYDGNKAIFKGYLQDERILLDAGEDFQKSLTFLSILDLIKHFDTDYDGIYINGGAGVDFEQMQILGTGLIDFIDTIPDLVDALAILDEDQQVYDEDANKMTIALSEDGISLVVAMLPGLVDGLLKDYGYTTQKVIDTVITTVVENVEGAKAFDFDLETAADDGLLPNITITLTFDLDENDVLEGLGIGFKMAEKTVTFKEVESFDYDENNNRTVNYAKEGETVKTFEFTYPEVELALDVALELTGKADPATVEDDFDQVDLINFEIDGAIDMAKEDGTTDTFNYVIAANVNPLDFIFVDYNLSPDKKDATIAALENVIKNMGYANITVTDAAGAKVVNVLLKGDDTNPDNVYVYAEFANGKTANFYFDITDLVLDISDYVSAINDEAVLTEDEEYLIENEEDFDIGSLKDMILEYVGKYEDDVKGLLESVSFDTATGLTVQKDLFTKIEALIAKINAEFDADDQLSEDELATINEEIDGTIAYIFGEDYVSITCSVAQNGVKVLGAPATTNATATEGAIELAIFDVIMDNVDPFSLVDILNALTRGLK